MVGIEVRRLVPVAAAIALVAGCAHQEDVDRPADSEPAEAGVGDVEVEGTAGECVPLEERGMEGFDYRSASADGAIRIELRETDFGHKMMRVVEQRPDGATRDLRYRSPEEELVIVESVEGEDPVRTVLTGEDAMTSQEAAWLGELLTQARAVCEYRERSGRPVEP